MDFQDTNGNSILVPKMFIVRPSPSGQCFFDEPPASNQINYYDIGFQSEIPNFQTVNLTPREIELAIDDINQIIYPDRDDTSPFEDERMKMEAQFISTNG